MIPAECGVMVFVWPAWGKIRAGFVVKTPKCDEKRPFFEGKKNTV
jgi:hypothetical protein